MSVSGVAESVTVSGRDADHRDRPLAGELDGRRDGGPEPAGQRPQLHRLRAAHAGRDARRRAPATSASPASAARSTAWSIDGADNNNTFFGQTHRPHRFGPRAVPVQPGRGEGVPGQLELVLGRVRPRRRRGDQRRDQVRHQRAPRVGVRVLPRQGAEREQRDQRAERPAEVALSLQPVRRHARRPDPARTGISSSSTTTASATPSRTSCSSTCRATTPTDRRDAGRHRPAAAARPRAGNARSDQDVFLVKTDHELNAANRLTLRYNHQNFTGERLRERRRAERARAHRRLAGEDAHLQRRAGPASSSSTLFNEVRVPVLARRGARARRTATTRRRSFSRAAPRC